MGIDICKLCKIKIVPLRHNCFSKLRCFTCTRIKANEDTFIVKKDENLYCSKIGKEEGTCESCRLSYRSKQCYKKHKTLTRCQRRAYCEKCKNTYLIKKDLPHRCKKNIMCTICYAYYDNTVEHYCLLQKQSAPGSKAHPLAAYDLETLTLSSASNCENCLIKEQTYLYKRNLLRSQLKKSDFQEIYCLEHQEQIEKLAYHETNFLSVVFENDKNGSFDLISMCDPIMSHPDDMVLKKNYFQVAKEDYYDSKLHGRAINRAKKKMSRKKKEINSSKNMFPIKMQGYGFNIGENRELTDEDIGLLKTMEPMDKFVAYFISPRFRNQVFLVISVTNN